MDASIRPIKELITAAHEKYNQHQATRKPSTTASSSTPAEEEEEEESPVIDEEDDRIHCLFYFMTPHRMKTLDIQCIRELSSLVPIVPILCKADMMTIKERSKFLIQIHNKLDTLGDAESLTHDFTQLATEMNTSANSLSAAASLTGGSVTTVTGSGGESDERMMKQVTNVFATICGNREYPWTTFTDDSKFSDLSRLQQHIVSDGKYFCAQCMAILCCVVLWCTLAVQCIDVYLFMCCVLRCWMVLMIYTVILIEGILC